MDSANATVEALRSRIHNTPTDDQELRLALISELNALIDPIQLLPLELSSKIFMLCYDKADAFVQEYLADVFRLADFGILEVAAWNIFGDSSMSDLSRFTSLWKLCILTELLIAKEVTYCELVGLLCTVPQLEECILPSSVWRNDANEGKNPAIATLPRLRRLTFMMDSSMDEHELPTDFTILQFLNLPALESLDIQLETIGFHNFLKEFFTRTAPMLHPDQLRCLGWSPLFRFLALGPRVTEIVSALAPHQSQAQPDTTILPLPNLRSLRFVRDYAPFLSFPAVASMLDARRSTLKEFKLYLEEVGDSGVPDAATAAAFERLRKAAGMEIFVGPMMPTYFEDLNRRILAARKRFS
ncbi:hypothetical protein C8F01DRAFT_1373436 [Mycena amicta]|nr:hypothetical protein C8F01DRAFT_1373436 [Mycena amicta]